jgi:hypothetical protein
MPKEEMVKQLRILETRYHMSIDAIVESLEGMTIKSQISTENMPMGKSETDPTEREVFNYLKVYGENKQ